MPHIEFGVDGMTCAACVSRVERAVADASGVSAAMAFSSVSVVTNSLLLKR